MSVKVPLNLLFRKLFNLLAAGFLILAAISSNVLSTPETLTNTAVSVPAILTNADIKRYKKIFSLQEKGQWKQADRQIKKIKDPILMGHVWFQRYMHPKKYRSKYSELAKWLKNYADHPDAWRVYRLARKRQGKARAPRRPSDTRYPGVTGQSAAEKPPLPLRSVQERKAVTKFAANIRRYVRKGLPERAEKRYWAMERRGLLVAHEKADALERIAASYYYKSDDTKAIILATTAGDLAREIEPNADWIAGLAHWRSGHYENALRHFIFLSTSERAGDWLLAAGNFWAGRTALRIGKFQQSNKYLKAASQYSETFYGLLAGRQLGIIPSIDWSVPVLEAKTLNKLIDYPATRRALALIQLDKNTMADEELRLLWGREGTTVQAELLALTTALNLPSLQIRLGRAGGTGELAPTTTRYPLPDWKPAGGFKVDRALMFAMIRKESNFRIRAKSHAGAGGLMQVMPATAQYITKRGSLLRRNRHRLYEPKFNMALGQRYIEYLSETDIVEGNLFMVLAAYNGGPGSLMEWREEVPYRQDPLLFIESIGFYETRNYIERVMANLWLYRLRLGQETPSLDALASGAWPIYENIDTKETPAAMQRAIAGTQSRKAQTLGED